MSALWFEHFCALNISRRILDSTYPRCRDAIQSVRSVPGSVGEGSTIMDICLSEFQIYIYKYINMKYEGNLIPSGVKIKNFRNEASETRSNERPPSKDKRLGSSRGFYSGIPQMRSRPIIIPNYARIRRPSGRTTRKIYPPMITTKNEHSLETKPSATSGTRPGNNDANG